MTQYRSAAAGRAQTRRVLNYRHTARRKLTSRTRLALAGFTLAVVASGGPAWGATASLVADLNTTPAVAFQGTSIRGLQPLGSGVLFFSSAQLWRSDGTVLGTQMVHDFCPEIADCAGGISKFLGTVGGKALLQIDDQLWSSDGTLAGTVSLGATLLGQPPQEPNLPITGLTASALFFFSCRANACGLWKSDGTAAGTVPVAAGRTETLLGLTAVGNRIFFGLETPEGNQLWTSDGTPAGTLLLGTFAVVGFDGLGPFFAAGSRLFFFATDVVQQRQQVWATDGTAAGTLPVSAFTSALPFGGTPIAKAIGAVLYFLADDGVHGEQLYASDGTAAGTQAVTAFPVIQPFGPFGDRTFILSGGDFLAQVGGRLLFTATDGVHPFTLWSSGGTPATTVPLAGCPAGCPGVVPYTRLTALGKRVVFGVPDPAAVGLDTWASDGSGAGTIALGVHCDSCRPSTIVPLLPGFVSLPGGRALFLGDQVAPAIIGVWITDGTVAGTRRLVPLSAFPGEDQGGFAAVAAGDKIFLADPGPDRISEGQLWVSDGTPTGTSPLTVFGTEDGSSSPEALFAYGGGVLFTACDGQKLSMWSFGVGGSGAAAAPQALLRVADCLAPRGPISYAVLNGIAYFLAPGQNQGPGNQLWRSDGTAAGTTPLTAFTSIFGATSLVVFQGKLFLSAVPIDQSPFSHLWSSDGTAAGTAPVAGFPDRIGVGALTVLGGRLYFPGTGSDGSDGMFVTDGTRAGTLQLTQWSNQAFAVPPEPVLAGGSVYFRGKSDLDVIAPALWKTDGTVAGTVRVLPTPFPGPQNAVASAPTDLAELGGALLFFGFTGNGSQRGLFRSDGTAAGTILLAPVAPPFSAFAPDSRFPADWTALGNRLFFGGDDGVHGVELWQTDGTPAGTSLVKDIAPGTASSHPASLVAAGGRLYFSADDGIYGDELWAYPLSGAACQPSATAMCLLGRRFRVEANWHDFSSASGAGQAVALTDDTGYFWFFNPANVELVQKIVDGRGLNGHFWSFYGALSSVQYELTVTDTQTGAARRYVNPAGSLASVADTTAFGPQGAHAAGVVPGSAGEPSAAEIATGWSATAAAPCQPGPARLCLDGGRFAVQATWRDFQGHTGNGKVVPVTGNTGYFWFFDAANVEVMLKVLDGRAVNGKFWVLYGALSNVEYTLTVTDTQTGAVRKYVNPAGRLASVADTGAF
jgi:ELWxxDGT repeat protein